MGWSLSLNNNQSCVIISYYEIITHDWLLFRKTTNLHRNIC